MTVARAGFAHSRLAMVLSHALLTTCVYLVIVFMALTFALENSWHVVSTLSGSAGGLAFRSESALAAGYLPYASVVYAAIHCAAFLARMRRRTRVSVSESVLGAALGAVGWSGLAMVIELSGLLRVLGPMAVIGSVVAVALTSLAGLAVARRTGARSASGPSR